ncbi:MAG: hypothetical protein JWQ35_669 [Bacteriovoracaceae bacterium]|nr:hypothetical protein [Bacteriovoracaceae bacterium]
MFIVLLLFFILIFYREILFTALRFLFDGEKAPRESWDIRLRVQLKNRVPLVYLSDSPMIETLSMKTSLGSAVFIHKLLWADLSNEEKEAYIAWTMSADLRASVFERIFFKTKVGVLDRDVALLGASPLALVSLLKKIIQFRESHSPSIMGSWLSGLSLLGPSFFGEWPSHDERMKHLASYLAESTKSQ